MWLVIKTKQKDIPNLKSEIEKKLGGDLNIYFPKLKIEYKNKFSTKNLLGNYFFFYHSEFSIKENVVLLNYLKGVSFILSGSTQAQQEIETFIERCKSSEKNGFISSDFFDLKKLQGIKLINGPLSKYFLKIILLQKNKINCLLGNIKTTINKKKYLFYPA
tara:strand:- start:22 stop:504 length:483 start_codon:yes stop_codon:yes gene_type:complete